MNNADRDLPAREAAAVFKLNRGVHVFEASREYLVSKVNREGLM